MRASAEGQPGARTESARDTGATQLERETMLSERNAEDRSATTCDLCRRPARYHFSASGGVRQRCLRHAIVYPPVFRRALRVALVVGTILFLINQLDVILRGDLTPLVAFKIGLTYLVPFSVSTFSALQINRV